ETLATAETLDDLLRAVHRAGARRETPRPPRAPALPRAPAASPQEAQTLAEVLDWHAAAHPDRVHAHLLAGGEHDQPLTYGQLRQGAGRIAAGLMARGLKPGHSVGLMLPTGRAYLESFLGVLLGGGVPVPIYPPARLSQIEDHVRRHAGILDNAQAAFLVTVHEAKPIARLLRAQVGTLREVATAPDLASAQDSVARVPSQADDTALLQYTSGSTGNPKGVVLTHRNLLANIRALGQVVRLRPDDVYVSWLPLYHDMGLIASWLTSLYFGLPFVLMSPLAFLARPQRWLRAIQHYRGTLSGAPNFAYELCARRIPDAELEGLDLSSWRVAYNGSEPVGADTVERFIAHFGRHGFSAGAMMPAFGLAECTVDLTCTPPGRGPLVDGVERQRFMETGEARPAAPAERRPLRFVSCGPPLPGHEIRIVGVAGGELGEREEGRVEFRGPSATPGYFRNPEQTRRLFRDGWLDTGDLGYVAAGELYLTGRAKDLIIRGGRHVHPYELEQAVGDVPGIRRGCVAAFGVHDPRSGTERVVVLAETPLAREPELEALRRRVNERCVQVLGVPADDVALVPPRTVLKTSSGKIRRAACRQLYQGGAAALRRPPSWVQLAHLGAGALRPELGRAGRWLAQRLFAAYAWLLLLATAPLIWLTVVALPQPRWRWAAARTAARLLLRATGLPHAGVGLDRVPRAERYIVVANHASYLDGVYLAALWPQPLRFVVKAELRRQFVAGTFLRRLGAEFVERFDLRQGVADTAHLADAAVSCEPLLIFPEGTFTRRAGLAPFHLGAFAVAAQCGLPVVPVALRGTRSVLRPGNLLPLRRPVAVVAGPALRPESDGGWKAVLRLRDAARAAILRHCGEPDLGV
ncbi:MAG: AMP-binding protein, partial [Gammaproteobacteria bacterium]|nr:AMP-binding protein [Gammaproteobacteria bacterium]